MIKTFHIKMATESVLFQCFCTNFNININAQLQTMLEICGYNYNDCISSIIFTNDSNWSTLGTFIANYMLFPYHLKLNKIF